MKTGDVVAVVFSMAFVGAIGWALTHRQSVNAGVHAAVIVDLSGARSAEGRCAPVRDLVARALADTTRERTVAVWFTGTPASTDGEPVHVGTVRRARTPVRLELPPEERVREAGMPEAEARCLAEGPAWQSPLFAAMAAALDGLRPLDCGAPGVSCTAMFATDGIETVDPVLMSRQAGTDAGAPRLDNRGIDVILCGTAARVPVRGLKPPSRAAVEAGWRAELTDPERLTIWPACVPGMRAAGTDSIQTKE